MKLIPNVVQLPIPYCSVLVRTMFEQCSGNIRRMHGARRPKISNFARARKRAPEVTFRPRRLAPDYTVPSRLSPLSRFEQHYCSPPPHRTRLEHMAHARTTRLIALVHARARVATGLVHAGVGRVVANPTGVLPRHFRRVLGPLQRSTSYAVT